MDKASEWESILKSLTERAAQSNDTDFFCEVSLQLLKPILEIETVILFLQIDDSTLETKARFGPSHGDLLNDSLLKLHRESPMARAYRSGKPQVWGDAQKMLKEFPDLMYWPRILHGVIAIPLVVKGRTIAGCVFVAKDGFPDSEIEFLTSVLTETSQLIYEVYLRKLGQFLLL